MLFECLLNGEHQQLMDTAHEFTQQEIAPFAAKYEEGGGSPVETVFKN